MLDAKLIGFSTGVVQSYTIAQGMANVTNNGVTVGGKTAPSATDAVGTNWLVMPSLDQISQISPEEGLSLGMFFSAGTATGTGTALFTPTISYGDDGSTVKSSRIGAPVTLVVTAGVLVPQYAQLPIGWIPNHKYWRVSWTVALSVITGLSITNFSLGWELSPDSIRSGVSLVS